MIGDSITQGVGGTGYLADGEAIACGFQRNNNGYCWANLFKQYIEKKYDCIAFNNGCSGTGIEFVIENFNELVEPQDDIVLCNIGTNNRHQFKNGFPKRSSIELADEFYDKVVCLFDKFKAAEKKVIFIANLPASTENEMYNDNFWRIIHMDDINYIYKKASKECGFYLISFYDLVLEYCENNNLNIDELLSDGLHPNDKGYKAMFDVLVRELGV